MFFPTQTTQDDLKFQTRLGVLGCWLRVRHNATAGEKRSLAFFEQGRTQSNSELPIALQVHPADGTGVPATVQVLVGTNIGQSRFSGRATNRRGRMQYLECLDRKSVV